MANICVVGVLCVQYVLPREMHLWSHQKRLTHASAKVQTTLKRYYPRCLHPVGTTLFMWPPCQVGGKLGSRRRIQYSSGKLFFPHIYKQMSCVRADKGALAYRLDCRILCAVPPGRTFTFAFSIIYWEDRACARLNLSQNSGGKKRSGGKRFI